MFQLFDWQFASKIPQSCAVESYMPGINLLKYSGDMLLDVICHNYGVDGALGPKLCYFKVFALSKCTMTAWLCVLFTKWNHRKIYAASIVFFPLWAKSASSLPLRYVLNGKFLLSDCYSFTLLQLSMASDAAWTNEHGTIITLMEVPSPTVIQLYLLLFCFPLSSPLSASAHNYTGLSSVLKSLWSVS